MPNVSICIPTYNRANYLVYSVNSVLNQTYNDFELIICDDGSTDNTAEVVSQWNDSRIRYIRHPKNIGRSKNMRSGFDAAQGTYFIKFDDDDALTPEFLERTVAVLDAEPTVDFVCTNHWVINQKGDRMESATQENAAKWGKDKLKEGIIPDLMRQTFEYQSLQVGSTLFRRACLEDVDYMRPEADGCEDFDLLVRLAIAGKQGYFLPEYLMEYRFHGGQTSLKQNLHFLKAKVFCINSYQFPDEELEAVRIKKLAWTQEALGLRLIENGDTVKGRQMLRESVEVLGSSRKTQLGLILSYLPLSLRQLALQAFRQLRPKDYTEQVREAAG
ncbi:MULTISPECIES: glycosyltransferase family 2 protein [unclassified Coleofasciculus]|uniref:glycosyltransferase family 2 protein n=1 Tax=unclassified Coleofasciculus TaxID=2692782 RepID=UPI00187F88B4|nr:MULTISPECIES: glycosyltransferase family 2 protein [unclassified Coleofasciculus]MBE9127279.1 glycosyltransferase family 2 protein [Coleofasciculus sp. LEGE 07081]MBE9150569.1 glycosyltransferase family 2 protein [Coleofasciculus sp. LEGE 07092]